ncbi:MAG: tetracycline regulation of excision, RteC, partial [Flavobacterium sp.]|nr:tetracycline regulation of excision, RteC [Flavobacterium sp.]
MKNYANQLLNQLEQQLTKIIPLVEEDPIQNCSLAINILMEGYQKLRTAFINKNNSQEEEIDFFKNDKPKLTSQIIYFNEI